MHNPGSVEGRQYVSFDECWADFWLDFIDGWCDLAAAHGLCTRPTRVTSHWGQPCLSRHSAFVNATRSDVRYIYRGGARRLEPVRLSLYLLVPAGTSGVVLNIVAAATRADGNDVTHACQVTYDGGCVRDPP